ncbi:formate dehydrogenase accessory sulfurtransferase FdhD [Undibacterium sp. RuRC25W]|uniref:formate dehydrogenase accessory sulfurtransferase FdhD n=1 Tax=Undibacterium sp. RuRC25W TaxID=3413047 RepID=UPI003BF3B5A6
MMSEIDKQIAITTVGIERHSFSIPEFAVESDVVSEEVPVALVFNGISHAVMMASPLDLEDFAFGFALSENIVDSISQIYDIEVIQNASDGQPLGTEVHLQIAQACFVRLKEKRRTLSGPTGCGLCGIESLQALDLAPGTCQMKTEAISIKKTVLQQAFSSMTEKQVLNALTGSMHAAGWVNLKGEIELLREDVGRHNALDKLIGAMAKKTVFAERSGFVIMSSRASYELVQKCARAQIRVLATVSAPTSLAISIARDAGICLIGFVRRAGFVVYTHPERLIAE